MTSPVNYLTDAQFEAMPIPERALHVAHSLIGVDEKPHGSNWGHPVQDYLGDVGIHEPAPWCAAFVFHCLAAAGMDADRLRHLIEHPASTYFWYEFAVNSLRKRPEPKRGRLFVYNKQSGGHIGFCLSDGDPFRTIEGNTNADGGREGWGVFERLRKVEMIKSYPRWAFIDLEGLK